MPDLRQGCASGKSTGGFSASRCSGSIRIHGEFLSSELKRNDYHALHHSGCGVSVPPNSSQSRRPASFALRITSDKFSFANPDHRKRLRPRLSTVLGWCALKFLLEHAQCAKGIFDGLRFNVMVCALRDGPKSLCDCGLSLGHALGKQSSVKFDYRRLVFGLPL